MPDRELIEEDSVDIMSNTEREDARSVRAWMSLDHLERVISGLVALAVGDEDDDEWTVKLPETLSDSFGNVGNNFVLRPQVERRPERIVDVCPAGGRELVNPCARLGSFLFRRRC